MNPELRAKLEGLDVWHQTLAAKEKRKDVKQTDEERRLAWQAYYDFETTKTKSGAKSEGRPTTMYVPEVFREIAAANGVWHNDSTTTTQPKEAKKWKTSADATQDAETHLRSITDLKSKVHEKEQELQHLHSQMTDLVERDRELSQRIVALEEDVHQLRNNCTSLDEEKQELSAQLQTSLKANQEMSEHHAALLAELEVLRQTKAEKREPVTSSEEVNELKRLLEEATEREESATVALEELQTEKDALLSKMKHAKQQFDKLRKQSYDRNVENDSLKAEVEELRASLAHTQTAATQQMVPLEELDEIRAQLRDAETEKSATEEKAAALEGDLKEIGTLVEAKDKELNALVTDLTESKESCVSLEQRTEMQEAELRSVHSLLEQCQQELEVKNNQVVSQETAMDGLRAQMDEALQHKAAEIEDLSEMLDQREQEMEALQHVHQTNVLLKEELKEKEHSLAEKEEAVNGLQEQIEGMEVEKEMVAAERAQQDDLLGKREQEILALKGQFHDFMAQTDQFNDELALKSETLKEKENQLNAVTSEIEKIREQSQEALEERDAELERLAAKIQEYLIQTDKMEQQIETAMEDIQSKDTVIASLNARLEEESADYSTRFQALMEERSQLIAQLHSVEQSVEELEPLRARVSELEPLIDKVSELESLRARVSELEPLVDEVSELEPLRTRVSELEPLMDKVSELESLRARVSELEPLIDKVSELEFFRAKVSELEPLIDKVSELEATLSEKTQEEQKAHQKLSELDSALSEALEIAEIADRERRRAEEEKISMRHQWEDVQKEMAHVQQKSESTHEDLSNLKNSLTAKSDDVSRVQSLLSRKEVEVESLKTKFQTAEAQLMEMTSELEQVRHNWSVGQRDLTEARETDIQQLKEDIAAARKEAAEMETSRDRLQNELHVLQQETGHLQNQLTAYRSQEQEGQKQLEEAKQYQYGLLEEIDSLKGALQTAEKQSVSPEHISTLQLQLQQATAANKTLTEQIQQLRAQADDVPGLHQKIVRLETALAIAGQSQPTPKSPVPAAELQALQDRATQAEQREADLYAEVESLRVTLDEARKSSPAFDAGPSEVPVMVGGLSNKKDEDRGYDVEAAVLSGGDPSGFQPLSGMLRGIPAMKYLSLCIRGADFMDRGFILLMRHPILRYILCVYFTILHFLAFV